MSETRSSPERRSSAMKCKTELIVIPPLKYQRKKKIESILLPPIGNWVTYNKLVGSEILKLAMQHPNYSGFCHGTGTQ
jgi:hypothetical protein